MRTINRTRKNSRKNRVLDQMSVEDPGSVTRSKCECPRFILAAGTSLMLRAVLDSEYGPSFDSVNLCHRQFLELYNERTLCKNNDLSGILFSRSEAVCLDHTRRAFPARPVEVSIPETMEL